MVPGAKKALAHLHAPDLSSVGIASAALLGAFFSIRNKPTSWKNSFTQF
jgi:hypothetical protein